MNDIMFTYADQNWKCILSRKLRSCSACSGILRWVIHLGSLLGRETTLFDLVQELVRLHPTLNSALI